MKLILRGISQNIDLYSPEEAESALIVQVEETGEVFHFKAPMELVTEIAALAAREKAPEEQQEEEEPAEEEPTPPVPQRKRLSAQPALPRNHVPPARRAPVSEDEVPPL